jgi:uncharacterized protein (DUF58 family)
MSQLCASYSSGYPCRVEAFRMSLRRNALLLILLTVLSGIAGAWSVDVISGRLWALPAALLLAGLAYEVVLLGRYAVEIEARVPQYWPLARSQPVELVFRQRSQRSLSIQVALFSPPEFASQPRVETLRLDSGTAAVATLSAAPRRLGRYAWPSPPIRVGGVLGLAWWPRSIAIDRTVTVVPDTAGAVEHGKGDHGGGTQSARTVGSGAEVLQLREYRKGDPLRVVDWKATARRRRLVSRDFSEDQHLEVLVAIDAGRASALGAGEVDRLSLYVNVAARCAERAVALDDAVGVMVFAAQPLALLPPARGEAAVARIRDLLTACRVQQSESNPVLAAAAIRSVVQRRSLIVFLTDLEDAAAGEQLARAVRLLTPKHLPFIAGFQSPHIEALSLAEAHEPLNAYRALAAVEYANTVAGNVRALRALGAAALTARPADLDRAVIDAYRSFRATRRI